MNSNNINIDQICSVRSYINYVSTVIRYKPKRKYFSFLFPKEGWYKSSFCSSDVFMTKDEIEKSGILFIENNKVYIYPHIEIKMSNDYTYEKYFKTEKELNDFMDNELSSVKWLKN